MLIAGIIRSLFFIVVWLPFCLLSGILIHELGHLLYGIFSGFKFEMIVCGPIGIKKVDGRLCLYWEKNKSFWGGLSLTSPRFDNPDNINIYKNILIAGPIASLIFSLLFIVLAIIFKNFYLFVLSMTIITAFFTTIIPFESAMFYTDGMRYRILKRKDERAFEEYAIIKISFSAMINNSYKNINLDDVNQLENSLISKNKYLGTCYKYFFYRDIGNQADMANTLEQIKELEKAVPYKYVQMILPEHEKV